MTNSKEMLTRTKVIYGKPEEVEEILNSLRKQAKDENRAPWGDDIFKSIQMAVENGILYVIAEYWAELETESSLAE